MSEADKQELEISDVGSVEYVVVDGVIYEPSRDSPGSDWYFVRRGEFKDSQLDDGESADSGMNEA